MKIEGKIVPGYLKALTGLDQLPGPNGERSVELFRHGTLTVKLYAPRGSDGQHPHTRDEIYVIATGTGRFQREGKRFHSGRATCCSWPPARNIASWNSPTTLPRGCFSTGRKAAKRSARKAEARVLGGASRYLLIVVRSFGWRGLF